jgi:hypothetical protein
VRAELTAQPKKRHKPRENSMSFQTSESQTAANSIDTVQIVAVVPQRKKSFNLPKAIGNGMTYLLFIMLVAVTPILIFVFAKTLYLELAKLSTYQLLHLIY